MSGVAHLKSRKSTLTDRKDAAPTDGEDFSLREDEVGSNDGTRDSTRRHRPTLQQFSSPPPKLWSSKHILALAFVFIVPLAYSIKLNLDYREHIIKLNLDSREHIMQLQLNNSGCLAKTHNLREKLDEHKNESEQTRKSLDRAQKEKVELQEKETECRLDSREQIVQLKNLREKVDELNKELEQTTKRLSDTQKKKEELREKETQCRLDLDMKNAEMRYAEEKQKDKEEYRSDAEQRRTAERDKLEYENGLWREGTAWLIGCLGRQNTDKDDFILTRAFNAIVRAIESGLGRNSDVENCLKMFSNRFQLRISA